MRTSIKKLKLCRFFSVEKLSVVFWLVSSGIIIGTMQNRFLNLDTFFICLAYDDLMVGISDGTNCFLIKLKLERENQYFVSRVAKMWPKIIWN